MQSKVLLFFVIDYDLVYDYMLFPRIPGAEVTTVCNKVKT